MDANNDNFSKTRLSLFDPALGLDRGVPKWKEAIWYLVKCFFFLTSIPYPSMLKVFMLRLFGAKVGIGLIIKPRVNIHMPWKLSIGNNVWIGEEASILNFENVTVGNDVCISQRAYICGGNHDYRNPSMPYRNGQITLMDGCWIGATSFIGPNVIVGIDSVVTVGTIVTSSLGNNGIYKGNPATYVKPRYIQH